MTLPLVSVVVPTRDRPRCLRELVAALRAQTLSGWEAVIVDDGSSAEAQAAAAALAAEEPRLLLVQRQDPSAGACACRNLGLRSARADLIVFLDDDDLLSPACLEARVKIMGASPEVDLALFPYERFREHPGDLPGDRGPAPCLAPLDAYLRLQTPWHTGGAIWRRSFLERLGGWDERLASWQDWELGIRALSHGVRYRFMEGPPFHVRVPSDGHRTISSGGWLLAHVRSWVVGLEAAVGHLRSADLLDARRQALLAWLYVFVAERLVSVGAPDEAARAWTRCRAHGLTSWGEEALAYPLLRAARLPRARSAVELFVLVAMGSPRFNAVMAALRGRER